MLVRMSMTYAPEWQKPRNHDECNATTLLHLHYSFTILADNIKCHLIKMECLLPDPALSTIMELPIRLAPPPRHIQIWASCSRLPALLPPLPSSPSLAVADSDSQALIASVMRPSKDQLTGNTAQSVRTPVSSAHSYIDGRQR